MNITDVTIIGAGISGSFAAFLLGQEGHSVRIIDPCLPEDRKSCGEGLSFVGQRYLERAGLWGRELASAQPFYGFKIRFADRTTVVLAGNSAMGHGVPRSLLDTFLVESAAGLPSVRINKETALKLTRHGELWHVMTEQGSYYSKHLVIASGRAYQKLLESSGIDNQRNNDQRYGLTVRGNGQWRSGCSPYVVIGNTAGIQTVITPLPSNRINISMLVTRKEVKKTKRELLQNAIELASWIGFENFEIEECIGASSLGSAVSPCVDGAYLVGDAAERLDPIGGMGLSHALVSASLAAEGIDCALTNTSTPQECLAHYVRRRRICTLPLRAATGLSNTLNGGQSRLLKLLVRTFPGGCLMILKALERLVPVVGLCARCPSLGNDAPQISSYASRAFTTLAKGMAILGGYSNADTGCASWYLPLNPAEKNTMITTKLTLQAETSKNHAHP